MWSGDVAEYSRQYRVLAVDLLGEPGKSAPNRPSWHGPAYAEWLDDVLGALRIEAARIIGLSQGGWTALKFAIHNPASVKALVVLSPGGIVHDKLSFVVRALPLLLMGQWGIRRINRLVLGGQSVPADVEETMLLLMTHFKARVGALPIFSDTELRQLTMPVHLVMGSQDVLRDAEKITARMKKLVPHLIATTIPGAGHALIGSRRHILPFLAASGSKTSADQACL
jgi:pimeloyl-ACP methyl ester carboxylesterase